MAEKDDTELKSVPGKQAAVPSPAVKESDVDTSARRKSELEAVFASHQEKVQRAHKAFPTPNIPFAKMSDADKRRAREKLKLIIAANRVYHLAVRTTCDKHRAEDAARTKEAA